MGPVEALLLIRVVLKLFPPGSIVGIKFVYKINKGGETMFSRKIKFSGVTTENQSVKFYIKDIHRIHFDCVEVAFNYRQWLNDGEFEMKEYFLAPESLAELITIMGNYKGKIKYSLLSSNQFLKKYPTMKKLQKHLDDNDKLPVDFNEVIT